MEIKENEFIELNGIALKCEDGKHYHGENEDYKGCYLTV